MNAGNIQGDTMHAKQALAHIRQQDWGPLKAFITSATPETAYELIRLSYEKCPLDTPLDSAISYKADVAGLILSGGLRFGISRRHRGMGTGASLSESQIENYYYHLNIALDVLSEALKHDRHNGLAAAFYMAANIDPFDSDQRKLAEARLLNARNVPLSGYLNLMQAHMAKWGGSHEDMFRIARARLTPDTPCQYALVARAHYEQYLYYGLFDDSPEADQRFNTYFDRTVEAELKTASESVLSATAQEPAELRLAHGWLAFTLSEAGLNRLAARHLKALKGFEDPSIWKLNILPPKVKKGLIYTRALLG